MNDPSLLGSVLKYMFPNANTPIDYAVSFDSIKGYTIIYWNEVKLGPIPTQQQIDLAEPLAIVDYNNKKNRSILINKITEALANAMIAGKIPTDFIMADVVQKLATDIENAKDKVVSP